ncbi:MAG TPA: response regulator [Elusimicrobiota bacterium]|nr:response regulator [Elusimicrobiota bacterium]
MDTNGSTTGKKIVVVIVEDDHYILDFMKFTLEQQGYEVIPAADGQEGLDMIQSHLPILVVLDLMLPKIDGFTILKRMNEHAETAKIPVVIVSAYTASQSTRRMVQSQKNVREVFTKPIRSKEFVAKLKTIIGA